MKILSSTYKNGMRLVLVPQPDAPTATVLILVGAGSKYESEKEGGLSHFLEHMMFKGTPRYPSAKILSELFDGIGAISNAFTDREFTGYYAKGSPKHVPTFIDVLTDIYLNALFLPEEVSKERGVIIEEINMYEDMPQYKAAERLQSVMYKHQPAGRSVLGTKETVSSFTIKDFLRYKNLHYTSGNTVLVVSGNFDVKKIKKLAAEFAYKIPLGTRSKKKKVIDVQKGIEKTVLTKQNDQAHIAIGFRAFPIGHKDAYALTLLSTILGGGASSRLFIALREELGAAYYVRTEYEALSDHGIFGIYAGLDRSRIKEIMERIASEIRLIKDEGASEKELAKTKEYMIGMMRMGLESSDSIAEYAGFQMLLRGETKTPDERARAIMKVTKEDVARVARLVLLGKRATISASGAVSEKDIDTTLFA